MGGYEAWALAQAEPTVKYHPYRTKVLILQSESTQRTVPGGQFDWGGSLLKDNGGAQWFPQGGRQSPVECKGIRELNCEADKPIRYESRA